MFTTRPLPFAAAALLATAALTAQSTSNFEKTIGNSDAGGTVKFNAFALAEPAHFTHVLNWHHGTSEFIVRRKLFGKGAQVVRFHASALSHNGKPHAPSSYRSASVSLKLGGSTVRSRTSSSRANISYTETVPIAGPAKAYGVGPFSVKVAAGLWADVGPRITATVANRKAEAFLGGDATVNAGFEGSIKAGPVGGCSVEANVELADVDVGFVGRALNGTEASGLELASKRLNLKIKLKAWTAVGINYKKTLINKSISGWTRNIGAVHLIL